MLKYNFTQKTMKENFGIYAIRQISTDKLYIGSTAQSFYDIICAHNSALRRNKHSSIHLQRAWNKYGSDDFEFEILEILDSTKALICSEILWIYIYKSNNRKFGFNVAKEVSQNRLGHTQKASTRKKIIRSDGKVFNSLKEAAEYMCCSYQNISASLRFGYKSMGYTFKYA